MISNPITQSERSELSTSNPNPTLDLIDIKANSRSPILAQMRQRLNDELANPIIASSPLIKEVKVQHGC